MKHYDQKQLGGGKHLLHFEFHIIVYYQKQWGQTLKQNRNLKAEAMEDFFLLAFFSWLAIPAFL